MDGEGFCFSHLNNSCKKPQSSQSQAVIVNIVLYIIAALTVVLNMLVIISISHFKQLHTPANLLLLSLAVSDLCVGFTMVFQVMLSGGCWSLMDFMCVFLYLLELIMTSSSVGTMVLISVDRYIAVCEPLHYTRKVTVKRTMICICLCWIFSGVHCNVVLRAQSQKPELVSFCYGECAVFIDEIIGTVDVIVTFIGPVFVIVALYVRIFVVAVLQARAMRSQVTAAALSTSVTVRKSELRAARTLGVIVVVFLVCLSPFFILVMTNYGSNDTDLDVFAVLSMFYINSSLNPLIYAFLYPWFRKSVKLIVTLEVLKPGSSDANILRREKA